MIFCSFGIVVVEVINEAIHFKRQKPFMCCQLVLQIEQVSGADYKYVVGIMGLITII